MPHARHDFVGYEGPNARLPQAKWLVARGATRFVFRSNSDFAIQEATMQGQGIAVLAEAQARGVPELVRLDLDGDVPHVPSPTVYLAYHREHRRVPRIRLVVDALESALRRALA